MSILNRVTKGTQQRAFYFCLYAPPGLGKSTFAASAPKCLLWDIEKGAALIDAAKLAAPESWAAFKADLDELTSAPNLPYQSIAIDTLDALEALATEHVCKAGGKAALNDYSWGVGHALLVNEWRLFLKGMETLRDKGINVILVAHEHRKTVNDPEIGSFDVFRPKLSDRVWGLTNENVDAVLFAQFEHGIKEDNGRKRAIISGRRVMRTQRSTGFLAKNRYGLPETLPLDWKAFEEHARPKDLEALKSELSRMLENPKVEQDTKDKVVRFLADEGMSEANVRAIVARLRELTT